MQNHWHFGILWKVGWCTQFIKSPNVYATTIVSFERSSYRIWHLHKAHFCHHQGYFPLKSLKIIFISHDKHAEVDSDRHTRANACRDILVSKTDAKLQKIVNMDIMNDTNNKLWAVNHLYHRSSPGMFPPVALPLEYWIEHVTIGVPHIKLIFSTGIFYKGAPGYTTDCPCGV